MYVPIYVYYIMVASIAIQQKQVVLITNVNLSLGSVITVIFRKLCLHHFRLLHSHVYVCGCN